LFLLHSKNTIKCTFQAFSTAFFRFAVAFRIYDINHSGAIEPPELRRFLVAVMADNPDIHLDEQALDEIVDETFKEIDLTKDGKIHPEDWMAFVQRNPSVISYMTLPVLTDLQRRFPPSPDISSAKPAAGR
jgi:serine/threonine-protein phosphatase 2B regulatory subunit